MTDRSQITVSEPVAWQYRFDDNDKQGWRHCDPKLVEETVANGWQVRALYTHPPSERVNDAMVERLARFIYRKESEKCATLEESLHWQANWRRAIPEAREMLEAAIAAEGLKEGG